MLLDEELESAPATSLVRAQQNTALWGAVAGTLLIQLVVLVLRSRRQWQHFNLSLDFAIFHQAWHQIGAGHLNPEISVFGYPFWQSHFELIMWPLALVGRVVPNDGLSLLYLQDLAIVGAEAVVVGWVWTETHNRQDRARKLAVLLALALLVANPWVYRAAGEDFHFQALATFFALLAAWELWRGQRRGWIWVLLALACGDVAATYVAGIGVSFLIASRRTRRQGLVLVCAGTGWLLVAAVLHANRGSGIAEYSYLASGTKPVSPGIEGIIAIAAGVVTHPSRVLQAIGKRLGKVWLNLAPIGVVGLGAPWSVGVVVIVLLENVLHQRPNFIEPSYQDLPVYLFGVLGSVLLMSAMSLRRDALARLGLVASMVLITVAFAFDLGHYRHLDRKKVSAFPAGELAEIRRSIPDDAQVVATFGVAGRFGGRRWLSVLSYGGQAVPIRSHDVFFVFAPSAGNQPLPSNILTPVEQFVRDDLRADLVHRGGEVDAYRWRSSGEGIIKLP
jgi:uncharacterized membrane protein